MDFLDPKKKRAHQVRLFIGYGLMAVVLLLGTYILASAANGFGYDRDSGTIIQNGIVYVDSHPVKGSMIIDGQQKADGDARLALPAGHYDLEIKRNGYRSWHHSFDLLGSTIERFVHPFLWLDKLESSEVVTYSSAPRLATQSPDKRWLLVQQPATIENFSITDVSKDAPLTSSFTLPATVLTAGAGENHLHLVEWSSDNRRVLLKHNFDGGVNYLIIDREEPASSVNLNKTFPTFPFNDVRLRDKKFDQLYLHNTSDGTLVTADVRTRAITASANKVLAFQPHGESILLYATSENATPGKALVRLRDGSTTYDIRELTVGSHYLMDLARFKNRWYMAIGTNTDPRVYLYRDMFDRLKESPAKPLQSFSVLRVDNPEYLSFSANSRFIGVQAGSIFAVYDSETKRSYRYDSGLSLSPGQKATWMDGHRWVVVSAGNLAVLDFNGTNFQKLVAANHQYLPIFARDYTILYTLGPSVGDPAKISLNSSELRLPADR